MFLFFLICSTAAVIAAQETFQLEGVVEDSEKSEESLAVINGSFYKKGDSIGEYQVESVRRQSVSLKNKNSGETAEIYLKEAVKKTAKEQPADAPVKDENIAVTAVKNAIRYASHPETAANRVQELKALRDLALINNASVKYYEKNKFFPVRLRQLTIDGFLPPEYESGKKGAYLFYLKNTPAKPDDFQLHADPQDVKSGLRFFFVGTDAVIRESVGKPAEAKSPEHDYFGRAKPQNGPAAKK